MYACLTTAKLGGSSEFSLTSTMLFGVYIQSWGRTFLLVNINRPDGATYSQTVYVTNTSWFLRLLEVNVLRSEHLIYHKNHQEPLIYGVFREKKTKALRFIRGAGHRLIPESLAPEVQAVYEETLIYKHTFARL